LIPLDSDNNHTKNQFKKINRNNDVYLDFIVIDDHLFTMGNRGLSAIVNNNLMLMIAMHGYGILPIPKFPNHYLLATHDSLIVYKIISQSIPDTIQKNRPADFSVFSIKDKVFLYQQILSIKGINTTIAQMIADKHGDIWLMSFFKGIFHLHFEAGQLNSYTITPIGKSRGLLENNQCQACLFNNQLIVGTQLGIYRTKDPNNIYPQKIQMEPYPQFHRQFPNQISIMCLKPENHNAIWLLAYTQGVGRFTIKENSFFWDNVPFKEVKEDWVKFFPESNGLVWIGGNQGIHLYNSAIKKNYDLPFHCLIRQVSLRDDTVLFSGNFPDLRKESIEIKDVNHTPTEKIRVWKQTQLLQPDSMQPHLDYKNNSLAFTFSATCFEHHDDLNFSYKMIGFDQEWSNWTLENKAIYTNLPEGRYVFQVKAKNIFDQSTEDAIFQFSIAPPWQRTPLAYIGYLVIFIVFLAGALHLNSRRMSQKQKKLEEIIHHRTKEVVRQKEEIETYASDLFQTNQRLEETKNALWGEMELAKKLQVVLLPKEPKIPGYDIAVYMNPADEVGGDYYDVICIDNNDRRGGACLHPDSERAGEKDGEPCRGGSCARPKDSGQPQRADLCSNDSVENKESAYAIIPNNSQTPTEDPGQPQGFAPTDPPSTNHLSPQGIYPFRDQPPTTASQPSYWLAIGDVSGHGVPAGLIMMMAQTAIHSVLDSHAKCSPMIILEKVNRIIYENIKKLGEDKYMTLTIFSCLQDDTLIFSGLHQDILVYRVNKKTVDLIESEGMWIGLTGEIGDMINQDQIKLSPGDTILLYTDGITEAIDSQGNMFSNQKLMQLFKECGCQSPEEIRQYLLNALSEYTCHDDVTMMIIKKL
jgi:serine phosphatase RsbU (regulator of sigma subunit)